MPTGTALLAGGWCRAAASNASSSPKWLLAHLLPSCLPSPRCFAAAGFLRLFSLVSEVDGSRQAGADSAPLTILHADLLSSFWVLGHLVMPLLLQAAQQQHQQVG